MAQFGHDEAVMFGVTVLFLVCAGYVCVVCEYHSYVVVGSETT